MESMKRFRSSSSGLFLALFLLLGPNVMMLLISSWLGVQRPIFNFDYAVSALVLVLSPFLVYAPFFLVAIFFDGLSLVKQIFPIVNLEDSLYLLGFIVIAPFLYQALFVLFLGFSLLSLIFLYLIRPKLDKAVLISLVNLSILAYILAMVFDGGQGSDYRSGSEKIVDSQAVSTYESGMNGFVEQFSVSKADVFESKVEKGVTFPWFSEFDNIPDKVLLIVSESWGASSEEIINSVLSPLIGRKDRFADYKVGELGVLGVTVQGEIRELCALRPKFFNLKEVEEEFDGCLPHFFRDNGYKTLAVHGATGAMYARKYWYPKLGFDEAVFFENKSWPKRCYSFPGACDSDVLNFVIEEFEGKEKSFVYWLTLNSHTPYDVRDLEKDVFRCEDHRIPVGSASCKNLKLHAQFFYNLAEALDDPAMRGVRVLIVGDHAPLILDPNE